MSIEAKTLYINGIKQLQRFDREGKFDSKEELDLLASLDKLWYEMTDEEHNEIDTRCETIMTMTDEELNNFLIDDKEKGCDES
jgi:hypothetical protein